MSKELIDAVVDMREEDAVKIAEKLLETGAEPLGLLDDCREALGIIGSKFAAGECFVPELILAGEMLRQVGALVSRCSRAKPAAPLRRSWARLFSAPWKATFMTSPKTS
jgi:5-methyltetrahydrofolate--homocysteine methyltransferase